MVLLTDGAKQHSTGNGQSTQQAQSGDGDGGGGDDADDSSNDATVLLADDRCAAFDGCRVWTVIREHGASVQGGTCADTHDVGVLNVTHPARWTMNKRQMVRHLRICQIH